MFYSKLFLSFFIIFFTLQLIFGEAGLLAFIQKKNSTEKFYNNVHELVDINHYLLTQVNLTHTNTSYLLMNAHRVGLLAKDEYLIKLDEDIKFSNSIYSPGTVVLEKKPFFISNIFLFIISLFLISVITLFRMSFIFTFSKSRTRLENSTNDSNQDNYVQDLINDTISHSNYEIKNTSDLQVASTQDSKILNKEALSLAQLKTLQKQNQEHELVVSSSE